jgi:hypothetical protein
VYRLPREQQRIHPCCCFFQPLRKYEERQRDPRVFSPRPGNRRDARTARQPRVEVWTMRHVPVVSEK